MARDISIAYCVRDQISPAINSMRNSNRLFNKDLEETQRHIDNLAKRQDFLTEGLGKSRQKLDETAGALRQAKKDFENYGEALGKEYLSKFYQDHEEAKQQVKDFESAIKSTRKEITGLSDDMNRAGNRAGATDGLLGTLGKAGLGKIVGDSMIGAVNVGISSAFGSNVGDAINTALSGTLGGAAMGFVAGGLPGAAVGAGVGLLAGGINAATGYYQMEDDAFKGIVQERYNSIAQQRASDLERGQGIASGRQIDRMAFSTMLGGDDKAEEFLATIRAMDRDNPFEYEDMTSISRILRSFRYDTDSIYEMLNTIGDAGAALGMGTPDMQMVAKTIGRMSQTATATRVDLNILTDRGIPAIEYLAKANNKTVEEVFEAISDSEISGKEAAQIITDYMSADEMFIGAMKTMSESTVGLQSRIDAAQNEMLNAMGEGYNAERDKGMRNQIDWYEGDTGTGMMEAKRMIGEYYASLDNLREQYQRDAMTAVMNGSISNLFSKDAVAALQEMAAQYSQAVAAGDGAAAGMALDRAQALAENEYNLNDRVRNELENQKTLVASIRDDTALHKEYYDAGMVMGQEFSKGLAAAYWDNRSVFSPNENAVQGRSRDSSDNAPYSSNPRSKHYSGNAWGIPYVPYDDYVIRAHQGERLLTASEARAQDSKSNSSLPPISGNNFIIREEADIYKIAQALVTELIKAQMIS